MRVLALGLATVSTTRTRIRRPGGRSARVRRDVLAATVDVLAEQGVAGFSIDAVAARAGVSKTTVYRRWPTTAALMTDAASAVLEMAIPVPNTGAVRTDLARVLEEALAFVTSPLGQALVHAALGAPDRAEVSASLQLLWNRRFARLGEIIRRAVDRGELPRTVDGRFLLELLAAPLYFRLFIEREKVDRRYLKRVVDHLLAAFPGD
jgi:AcrR family transcriptional regulator